jgi:hypothetical protein
VSLFVLSPEIEDRDEVEVGNWAKHKKTFYSERYNILFYLQADHKKKSDINSFIFFCCSYSKMTILGAIFDRLKINIIPCKDTI